MSDTICKSSMPALLGPRNFSTFCISTNVVMHFARSAATVLV